MVIPTLAADAVLIECLDSLANQTLRDFDIFVVDNSGSNLVRQRGAVQPEVRVIENSRNLGFGVAVNQAYQVSRAPWLATLNDDAVAAPNWFEQMLEAGSQANDIGMVAAQVRLAGSGRIDSAGMLVAADGSSKQRGHGRPHNEFQSAGEVLLPSGSAAFYRRTMLDQVGAFDSDFFLYCEDTDLGLRARWAGWRCVYAPGAVVEHRYSHSAGRASALKAYYVERNRLFVVAKNFPVPALVRAPVASVVRYFWHAVYIFQGRGASAEFARRGNGFWLPWYVLKAHWALLVRLPSLLRHRKKAVRNLTTAQFMRLLDEHTISAREVAAL